MALSKADLIKLPDTSYPNKQSPQTEKALSRSSTTATSAFLRNDVPQITCAEFQEPNRLKQILQSTR